ncbi:helix-turn-helix domain-containing protein [Paenibacillus ehimensis]|uniref:Helix-turn-helix transcriptional regulator n=1 Tax=Paenibacillus ehimensis TaxID=79264 RepID=A0ABT8VM09_9BACL|nr:helix-turn-helix transcriptional regulator [Paenibacillus ehimensis]MDO3682016.1 helix-turn-helix transcriptional regulator [Paenibacillus ehimensis]
MAVTFAEQIGAKIRIHRLAKNWTQEQLAEKSNMTASYVGQLERGEKDVRISTLEKIAHALGMSVHELFSDQKEAFIQEKTWVWESILLLLKHNEQKQHQAYRILRELLEPSDPEK